MKVNIFNRLAAKKQEAERSAIQRYYELLTTIDLVNTKPADENALVSLIGELGFTTDRVEADHKAVQTALAEYEIQTYVEERQAKLTPAYESFMLACKARQEGHAKLNEDVRSANNSNDQARSDFDRATQARRYINELAKDNPVMGEVVTRRMQLAKATKRK